jgi:hypothetical protein
LDEWPGFSLMKFSLSAWIGITWLGNVTRYERSKVRVLRSDK